MNLKSSKKFLQYYHYLQPYQSGILLLIWIAIAAFLRLNNLTAKPIWTDEFATLVFSLGNDFDNVPLGQVISAKTLLEPLRINPDQNLNNVIQLLLDKDNHPPFYFAIAHLWQTFLPHGDYINLWVSRALPAFLGILAIPLTYFIGYRVFKSQLLAHLTALMMAVSPYGIFLSQEARHYTFAMLWVLLSIGCFLKGAKYLSQNKSLPYSLILTWVMVNGLGLSTHFFCGLAFFAEFIALALLFGNTYFSWTGSPLPPLKRGANSHWLSLKRGANWLSLLWVILGTLTTAIIWIWVISQRDYGNGMTQWIKQDNSSILGIINPPIQLLAAWVTMLCLLPVESPNLIIAILAGFGMLIFLVWFIPLFKESLRQAVKSQRYGLETRMLLTSFICLVGLYLTVTYFVGMDITRGARYSFTYLPFMVFLLGISLTVCWQEKKLTPVWPMSFKQGLLLSRENGKVIIFLVILMGFLSGLTITDNLGYQKYYRPEQFLSLINQKSQNPVLIATTHQSLVQTGEMMSIAWEIYQSSHQNKQANISFLLIPQSQENSPEATQNLMLIAESLPKPMDIWVVNFKAPVKLPLCNLDSQKFPYINGYGSQLYHCQ